ncbi:MAG: sacsin N-terminal ATP-binding-like domain-containing protein [Candidatus Coproplasma sp.]
MTKIEQLYKEYFQIEKGKIGRDLARKLREELKGFKREELSGIEDHIKFLELLRLFREVVRDFGELNGDNYLKTIREMLSVGTNGIYSNELRFLNELIQNVDDCYYKNTTQAKLDIRCNFNDGELIFEYNEDGFTPFNVFSITGIAEAAKNIDPNKTQIGEKGLGFKSVFGVATEVLIQSGLFSFKLHKDDFTCPIPCYDGFEYQNGTKLTLFMEPKKVHDIFKDFTSRYKSKDNSKAELLCNNPLLFLNNLTSLKVYFDNFRSIKFTVERNFGLPSSNGIQKAEHVKVSYEDGDGTLQEITCTHYVKPIVYDREMCISRYGEKTEVESKDLNMQIVVPDVEFVKGKSAITSGKFYSFLPTQIKMPVSLVCHIPFKLDPSREQIDSQHNNAWFVHSYKSFSEMFDDVLIDLAQTYKEDIIYYLPKKYEYLFQSDNGYNVLNLPVFKGEHFLSLPLFYTGKGDYLSADKLYVFAEPQKLGSVDRAAQLLGGNKQLFHVTDISKVKGLNIEVIENLPPRLFNIAIKNSAYAEEIFKILEAYEGFYFEDVVKNIGKVEFDISLVNAILNNEKCSAAFKDYAKKCARGARPNYSFNTAGFSVIDVKNVDDKQEILDDDFGKYSKQYLSWINNKVVVTDLIPAEQYLIANNVLILSKDSVLKALSDFCHDLDPKDLFSARLILRNCSRELDLVDDSLSAEEYLRKLRNVRKAMCEAFVEGLYKNYINLINQAGTNPERYINELLQNADDCKYPESVTPEFRLEIDKGLKIIGTRYNEIGFKKSNVRAITAIGESTKKKLMDGEKSSDNLIGEKGVGFKSVFAVADKVSIYSGDFCFSLSAKEPLIPKILKKSEKFADGTTMFFELKEEIATDLFTEEKVLRLCLCLRNLRQLKLDKFNVVIKDEDGVRTITINENVYKYNTVSYNFDVDDQQALEERRGLNRDINKEQTIKFYIPTGNNSGAKSFYLYSGLPTEIQTKIPLIIDAPFELDTARNNVIENKWNTFIKNKLYEGLKEMLLTLCEKEGIGVLRFIGVKRENNSYLLDTFTNSKLNDQNFLSQLKALKFLQTWNTAYYACANQYELYRIPDWLSYVLEHGGEVGQSLSTLVKCREEMYESVLAALGVKVLPLDKAVRLLKNCYAEFIENADFSKLLYAYFEERINSIDTVRNMLKDMKIIPVKGKSVGVTEYLSWNECCGSSGLNLYVQESLNVSDGTCWILRIDLLKKDLCERIIGANINELTDDYKRSIYERELISKINSGLNSQQLYAYLLDEFINNSKLFSQCRDRLYAYRNIIPLKNQFGEIKKGKIYFSSVDSSLYYGKLFPSHLVNNECERFAKFIECKDISSVHFDELDISQPLTRDDVEMLQDETIGIVNSDEIISRCIERGFISQDLIAEYGLGAYSPVNIEYFEDVFNQPIEDRQRFYGKLRERINNPSEIFDKSIETTVKFYRLNGKEYPLNYSEKRYYITRRYSLSSKKDYCVCQMCKKAKKINYIEVNNLELLPKYYWVECGVSLCLECSKRFEELRENKGIRDRFYKKILEADVDVDEPIEIPVSESEAIMFGQSHLAEIQEILKKQEEDK